MMQINTKSIFRVLTLGILIGAFSSFVYGQQWGEVVKSNETAQVGNQVYFVHTVAKGNTFYSLTKVYGVSVDEIKEANPGLENELKVGNVILIPKVTETIPVVSSTTVSNNNYFYHVVKQGESLFGIAKIFGVKAEDLQRINELNSTAISPGFHLKIPEVELKAVDIAQKIEPQKNESNKDRYFKHTVQAKETLFSIAKYYGIGVETLKYINNFTGNDINPGQVVLIPTVVKELQAKKNKKYIIHQVQAGEGLFGIARKYGVSIEQIKAFNPGLTEEIAIGQEIKIPRKPNTKGYIEHRVADRTEKLSNIALEYEVTINNLKELNPDASKKVKRGETVFIPLDFIDQKGGITAADQFREQEKAMVEQGIYTQNKSRVFNVALMLPLYLNDVDSMLAINPHIMLAKRAQLLANHQDYRAFKFLEFYEGAKIAVDSLRQLGMQVNIQVYDVNDDKIETALLLQDPKLLDLDLIISLLYSQSFAQVSEFSKENRIPLVNALSTRRQIVYENPFVFKLSPNTESKYNRVANFVGKNFSNCNTIIVRNNPYQFSAEYELLSKLLQEKLNSRVPISNAEAIHQIDALMKDRNPDSLNKITNELIKGDSSFILQNMIDNPFDTTWVDNPLKTVIYSRDSLRGIMQQASVFRGNLVIALGADEVFAIELFTKLNFVRDSFNIKVIGLPDWHDFMNLDVDYSQAFSLRVISENFVDYSSPEAMRFADEFQENFNKVPEIDTYSYLGYDATFYFLQALFNLGDDWLDNISNFQIPLIQNQYHFEKLYDGGFENTYWNLYRQENYQYKLEK